MNHPIYQQRWFSHSLVLLLSLLLTACQPIQPGATIPNSAEEATVRLGVFSTPLAVLVAQEKGFFADQQLTVEILRVTSSTQQFTSLRDGEYDLISTSPDNVLNYRLNESNALGETFPVQAIAGSSYGGNLSVVGQPDMTALTDFRGRAMAVDSPSSGFAYVLYRMLGNAGLVKDVDYTVVACGGGTQRYKALLSGACENGTAIDGGALLSGLTLYGLAEEGFPILQTIQEAPGLDPYLGSVIAATEPWLTANEDVTVRFIAALLAATEWTLDPANRDEVIALLATQPNATPETAEQQYQIDTAPGLGLIPTLEIDLAALRAVVELRDEFNGFDEPQDITYLVSPDSHVYDSSYLTQAEKRLVR